MRTSEKAVICGQILAARPHAFAAGQKGQSLEQVDILLVFQQRAVQRRDQLVRRFFAQGFRIDLVDQQQFQPVQQFGSGWLLLEAGVSRIS